MKKIIPFFLCLLMLCSCSLPINKRANDTFDNITGEFVPLKDAVVVSSLPTPTSEFEISDISGEGVLYGDTISKINLTMIDEYTIEIEIDGINFTHQVLAFQGAAIVDINKNDSLNELVLFSDGASCDPAGDFFHFDGKKIMPINHRPKTSEEALSSVTNCSVYGSFLAGENDVQPTYGAIWTDQNGKIITSFQNIGFTEKRIALAYFELSDGTFNEVYLDKPSLPKDCTVTNDFSVFVTPVSGTPDDLSSAEEYAIYDFNNQKDIKQGTKIKIIDIAPYYNFYNIYAEIDGSPSVLTFWLGD